MDGRKDEEKHSVDRETLCKQTADHFQPEAG